MKIFKLYLDKNTSTNIHGKIYGMDYEIEEKDYYLKVFLDIYNQRVQVLDYEGPDIEGMVKRLDYIAEKNTFGKVYLKAKAYDWEKFLSEGYILEGIFKFYYSGENAYSLAKFFNQERRISYDVEKENEIIKEVTKSSNDVNEIEESYKGKAPEGYVLRYATYEDLDKIAELYDRVFETYPIPLNQKLYLERLMDSEVLFMVIAKKANEQDKDEDETLIEDEIVSVASADMHHNHLTAEMTDCATLPEERGKGHMGYLMKALEKEMIKQNMISLFSLARAKSPGMNLIFHRFDYSYCGRLIKNCNIYGNFENMNLWVKKLQ
ncbi:putative beta-lysine N-acetyltransferase [Natranaerofaba carboxydovora]|uniref:putative beta-lysine N-acetyltransferase n=1 Tax=Natranaerofaba carboxydovora TaxID=2742683 RepID=UPI001F1494AB|nr:putative beta-lysine N-acetyltransferase [Natranaerofaba carboxydovora]UMZ75195.1 N-acetyltransferase YodP [Natranaerofaba carboxydovora]